MLLFRLNDVPPGLQHDQMFNVLDAQSVLEGHYPLYFPANFGREPLFLYFVAGVMKLAGAHTPWTLRLASAAWGLVGLALTLPLGRRFLSANAALLSSTLLAGSLWFLFVARLGLRAITLLALTSGLLYFLSLALRRTRWRDWLAAGLFGGVALYCYLAARLLFLLPILLLTHALLRGLRERRFARREIGGPFAVLLTMGLIGLPLYLYSRANSISGRVSELNQPLELARQGDLRPLLAASRETVVSLLWAGQDSIPYHYSLPGEPVLAVPLALAFLAGLLLALRNIARQQEALLLSALLVGLLPDMATFGGPIYLRAIMAMPVLFILAAHGFAWATTLLQPRLRRSWAVALLALLLAAHYAHTVDAYFRRWATAPETMTIYNGDLQAIARLPRQPDGSRPFISADSGVPYWLPALDRQTYRLYESHDSGGAWFRPGLGLPLDPTMDSLYLLTVSGDQLPPALASVLTSFADPLTITAPGSDLVVARGYRLSPEAAAQMQASLGIQPLDQPITYGEALRLDGAVARQEGSSVQLFSVWTVQDPAAVPEFPRLAFMLYDAFGDQWSEIFDLSALDYHDWRVGDQFLQYTELPLPGDAPPGEFEVRVGLAQLHTPDLIFPIQQGDNFLGAPPPVARTSVEPPPRTDAPAPPILIEGNDGDALTLLGAWEQVGQLIAGAPSDIKLSWRATRPLRTDALQWRLQATAQTGEVLWSQEAAPLAPPPAEWPAGQSYRLTHRLLPAAPGIGSWDSVYLELCAFEGAEPLGCGTVGEAQLWNPERVTTLPAPPQVEVGASWQDALTLAGYDVERRDSQLALTLYWHVEAPPSANLTRFVHLLDAGGQILAQQDQPLDNRGIPREAWQRGEYIVDEVVLDLPPGTGAASFRVGLYDSATGERLPVRLADGQVSPDASIVLPLAPAP